MTASSSQKRTIPGTIPRTSSYSYAFGNCVEVGVVPGQVMIRDTMHRDGPALGISPRAWRNFTQAVRHAAQGI